MNKFCIGVVYRHTPDGRTALSFSSSLLKPLGVEQLQVFVDGGSRERTALAASAGLKDSARLAADNLVAYVKQTTGLSAAQIELRSLADQVELPAEAVVVDGGGGVGDGSLLVPFDEPAFGWRGEGPLVIPFGTDESALRAASVGIPLAKLLNREVVFYHTTWTNPSVEGSDPGLHVCSAASRTEQLLTAAATAAGVKYRVVIETALDVVLGTLRCAVRERANLLVMAREPKIIHGSYVDRALLQSTVPMLVVKRPIGGAAC
jgi:nucleotide-binding universal stress UspA family protein